MDGTNAHDRAAQLWDGSPHEGTADLTDYSVEGDWRLPTETELLGLMNGPYAVSHSNMRAFTDVQLYYYWSSTTYAADPTNAWCVITFLLPGQWTYIAKDNNSEVWLWPVRSGN